MAQFAQHFHVVGDPFVDAFSLQHTALFFEKLDLLMEVVFDFVDGTKRVLLGGHEEVGRIDLITVEGAEGDTTDGIYFLDTVYLVAPEDDTQEVVAVGQEDVYRIAFDTEIATVEIEVVTLIEAVYQAAQEDVAAEHLAPDNVDTVVVEIGRIAHAVDAGHGGDDNHVLSSAEQGRSGGQTELVDFVVDGQVFFDIGIRRGEIGFGLVVIVVRDIILDGIVRKESLELTVELSRQGFVVAQDECRLVDVGNDVGDGKCLSGARNAKQSLGGQSL